MNHLDEGLLHAWLDDEVGPVHGAGIEQHLEQCAVCAELLEAAARDRAAASELLEELGSGPRLLGGAEAGVPAHAVEAPAQPPGASPEAEHPGATHWRGLAWAASIVLAVALGWFARPVGAPPVATGPNVGTQGTTGEAVRQGSEARLTAPALATALELASPAAAAAWLGREPLVPGGTEVLRTELWPAGSVPGSRGNAPVVVLELRASQGDVVRVLQQRVEAPVEASESPTDLEAMAAMSARAQLGDLLVLIEGPNAPGILVQLRDMNRR